MNATIRTALTVLAAAAVLPTAAQASEQLAQRHACMACHHADAQRVGPSWARIRDKYKDGSVNAAQLARSIKAGGTGKWGAIPMPPQPALPDADAQALASWILGAK
jgi:cytochrome c